MAIQHLTGALSSYEIERRVPIMCLVYQYLSALYSGLTERELLNLGQELSQVSGGSGMDIIGLLLLQDDAPELIERLSNDICWRLDRYVPGAEYSVHLRVEAWYQE